MPSSSARAAVIGAPAGTAPGWWRGRTAQQALAAAEAGDQAEVDFRLADLGGICGDAQMAAIASSSPPPSAKPFTRAMTGFGIRSIWRIRVWPDSEKSRP